MTVLVIIFTGDDRIDWLPMRCWERLAMMAGRS